MNEFFTLGVLLALGLLLGSFAGASVWRLRARQLNDDKQTGELVDEKEYTQLNPLTKETLSSDRSRCLHCGHTLGLRDLIPLASWLSTKGKCRYCGMRIGKFEPLMELGLVAAFVVSYVFWPLPIAAPLEWLHFILWLGALVMLAILFAYDAKWFLLPDRIVFPLTGVGFIISAITVMGSADKIAVLASVTGAVVALGGLYYAIWLVSKGRWVGFGDVKLGLALALLLADWRYALIALFSANLIGSLIVIPGILTGKVERTSHVPFGPLLIAGTVIAKLFGEGAVLWYQGLVF